MSCTSPLYRIPVASRSFAALLPFDQNRKRNGGVFLRYDELQSYNGSPNFFESDVQVIRCGQCIDCRLAYSRDWAVRCSLEAAQHEFNYFVTLTYDDFHLPGGEYLDVDGEVKLSSLNRSHVVSFIKRFREWDRVTNGNTGLKVFYCGEYGDRNDRPHYHLCIFGCSELPDLSFSFQRGNFKYFKSDIVERCWSERIAGIYVPFGFVDISECSFDSIAYTARYIMKKQKGKSMSSFFEFYNSLDDPPALRVQPFVGMSRRPGIASAYFEQNADQILLEDKVKYQKAYDLYSSKPPRYFDKLFEARDPVAFTSLKKRRSVLSQGASNLKRLYFSESVLGRLKRENSIASMKETKYHVRPI